MESANTAQLTAEQHFQHAHHSDRPESCPHVWRIPMDNRENCSGAQATRAGDGELHIGRHGEGWLWHLWHLSWQWSEDPGIAFVSYPLLLRTSTAHWCLGYLGIPTIPSDSHSWPQSCPFRDMPAMREPWDTGLPGARKYSSLRKTVD